MTLAAACLLVALGASAATPPAKPVGTVVKSASKISPGADGPVFREGRVTVLLAKTEVEEEYKATAKTKVTLDGKPAKFKAALPGTVVLRVALDPKTKTLSRLDLKSAPRPVVAAEPVPAEPGRATGEVADTDVIKGRLSIRLGPNSVRDYSVSERTRIAGQSGSPLGFDAIKVGDSVDVNSEDGRSAAEILVRVAP